MTIDIPLRNYQIAGNILDNVNTIYGRDKSSLCISVAEVCFISIDWFARCLKVRKSHGKTGNYADPLLYVYKYSYKVLLILNNDCNNAHEEHFLKVSDRERKDKNVVNKF